jgi:hypothetical protein
MKLEVMSDYVSGTMRPRTRTRLSAGIARAAWEAHSCGPGARLRSFTLALFSFLAACTPQSESKGQDQPRPGPESTTEASYLVFARNKTICAKNGRTGRIDFEGEEARSVINSALAALDPARTWKETVVLKGSFEVNLAPASWDANRRSGIEIPNYTALRIQGRIRLRSKADSAPGQVNYIITNKDHRTGKQIDIQGGEIDGNGQNNAHGIYGVQVSGVSDVRVVGMYIHDCRETGVAFENVSRDCWAINNHVVGRKDLGLFWQDGLGNQMDCRDICYLGNLAEQCHFWGIYIEGGSHITAVANTCRRNGKDGILVGAEPWPGNTMNIVGNMVYENNLHGIFASSPNVRKVSILGNQVMNNAAAGKPNSGIVVKAHDAEIQGNLCWDDRPTKTQEYGVALLTGAESCRVLNNNLRGNKLGGLLVQAGVTNCFFKNNAGHVTETSGIATGRSPITVAHGLDPLVDLTRIRITLGVRGDKPLRTSWRVNPQDRAKIDIFHDGQGTAEIAWSAQE